MPRAIIPSVILLLSLIHAATTVADQGSRTGTCIVYIRNRQVLWIGSDSLRRELANGRLEHRCAINREKDTYFAVAGVENFGRIYDAIAEARRAIDSTSSTTDARDKFAATVTKRLEHAFPEMLKAYPAYFDAWNKPNPKGPLLQAVFIEMMNGIVYAERVDFFVKVENGRRVFSVQKTNCPGECAEPTSLTPIGDSKAFQPPFDFAKLPQNDPIVAIRTLIELEMKADPKTVGGHINIFMLDKSGGHWLTQNAECGAR